MAEEQGASPNPNESVGTETEPNSTSQTEQPKPETDLAAEVEKWKSLSRKNEEQAKANADAAKRLKELEDAQKTEQQKLTEALEAAKAEGATSKAEAARLRAAIKHGLSEDDLDLLGSGTPEEIEARAEKLAARLEGAKPKTVPASRRQGGGGGAPEESVERVVESIPRL